MKRSFSWEPFSREFLLSVIESEETPEKLRKIKPDSSKLLLSARMDRLTKKPDKTFIRRYRREIEQYVLCDMDRVNRICTFLHDKNTEGILIGSGEMMKKSLFSMPMTPTVCALYLDELNQIGMMTDDSKEKLYWAEPKTVDLSCTMPRDISMMNFQHDAVEHLCQFYDTNSRGVLVMPTGSGKTRTAVYFLLRNIISRGIQVLWLAHRSLLLEQTANTFIKNASLLKLSDNKHESMKIICVSGEHCRINRADTECDIVVGSVQSLYDKTDVFPYFLRDNVLVVVDEAHHTTAKTYRTIIDSVMKYRPNSKLLGLTATPVRLTEKETCQLMKIYNDTIIYSISLGALTAEQVLAEPIWESVPTDFDIETHIDIDEQKYILKWGELSPRMVDFLANVCQRNELIVDQYLKKRKHYGKTIVFALNAHHCLSLCDLFIEKGVKCDYVYSDNDNDNAEVIRRFKNGEIEVLVNINILTEGSDIPDIQTVFITRPTQSDVLLMQMIGRGMRGKGFGGTETVNIVDFCDKWENFNKWLNPKFIYGNALPFEEREYKRYHIKKYPWEMFRDIINGISYTYGDRDEECMVSVPVGWYDTENYGHRTNVIVFENQLSAYEKIMSDYQSFIDKNYSPSDVIYDYFRSFCLMPSENDVSLVIDEIKRTNAPLVFHSFEERSQVDALIIAEKLKAKSAVPSAIEKEINELYGSHAAIIDSIYGGFDDFRDAVYNGIICGNDIIAVGMPIKELEPQLIPYSREPIYDIEELYDEVYMEMFKGKFKGRYKFNKDNPLPKISWTDKPYSTYYGVFYPERNQILINCILNSASVPKETVKFIIYHELLHTELFYHTKEFYKLEHKYPDFAAHNHFLDDTFGRFDFTLKNDVR